MNGLNKQVLGSGVAVSQWQQGTVPAPGESTDTWLPVVLDMQIPLSASRRIFIMSRTLNFPEKYDTRNLYFLLCITMSDVTLCQDTLSTLHVVQLEHRRKISLKFEPPHNKTNLMTCAPNEDSNQPGHPPSLIRVFAVRSVGSQGSKVSSVGQRRLWLDWAYDQADLNLCWAHRWFCWFCHAVVHFNSPSIVKLLTEIVMGLSFHYHVFVLFFTLIYREIIFLKCHQIWASSRENLSSGFSTRQDSNRPAQLQKVVRVLKFRIQKLEVLYYLGREQQRRWSDSVHAQADLRLCCSHRAKTGFLMTRLIYYWSCIYHLLKNYPAAFFRKWTSVMLILLCLFLPSPSQIP